MYNPQQDFDSNYRHISLFFTEMIPIKHIMS